MLVTSIQLPNGIQNSSKCTQNEECFQDTLTQVLNNITKKSEITPIEEEDQEQPPFNPFMLLSAYLLENEIPIEEVGNQSSESDLSIKIIEGKGLINVERLHLENIIPENHDDLFLSEGVLEIEENIISDKQTIPLELEKDFELDIKKDNKLIKDIDYPHMKVNENDLSNEKVTIPEKITNDYKNHKILEDVIQQKAITEDEEVSITKEKDLTLKAKNPFNSLILENNEIKQTPKITQENQVLSKENIQNINNTIIKLVETTAEGQTSVMKVQLYPEDLGTVNVILKMEEGKIIAKIMVDNNHIKQIFSNKINELSENLIKQNINMEKVDIELNPNLNLNSSSDFNEGFNRNNRNHFKRNQIFSFEKESINGNILDEKGVNNGAISILA